jgi:hypothetical protein
MIYSRAASRLLSTAGGVLHRSWCRDESRHGTHECVRHIGIGLVVVMATAVASSPDSNKREERAHQLVADVCTSCHDLARVKVQALSKEEWAGLIKGMVSEGAAVSDEEMDLIVDYLARHFGYRTKDGK